MKPKPRHSPPRKPRNVWMSDETYRELVRLGDGKASDGLETLINVGYGMVLERGKRASQPKTNRGSNPTPDAK
jgi:hypothetical protein